ncbi:hypothetical protein LJR153_005767 [Paenibacillus sp. LjRoot153]
MRSRRCMRESSSMASSGGDKESVRRNGTSSSISFSIMSMRGRYVSTTASKNQRSSNVISDALWRT